MKQIFTSLLLLASLAAAPVLRAQTLDPTFQATVLKASFVGGLLTGPQLTLVQPDGKILVVGGFDFANGALASKLVRLNVMPLLTLAAWGPTASSGAWPCSPMASCSSWGAFRFIMARQY